MFCVHWPQICSCRKTTLWLTASRIESKSDIFPKLKSELTNAHAHIHTYTHTHTYTHIHTQTHKQTNRHTWLFVLVNLQRNLDAVVDKVGVVLLANQVAVLHLDWVQPPGHGVLLAPKKVLESARQARCVQWPLLRFNRGSPTQERERERECVCVCGSVRHTRKRTRRRTHTHTYTPLLSSLSFCFALQGSR